MLTPVTVGKSQMIKNLNIYPEKPRMDGAAVSFSAAAKARKRGCVKSSYEVGPLCREAGRLALSTKNP